MANDNRPTTITQPGQFSISNISPARAEDKAKIAILLTSLASFYWRPDFGPAQAAVMIADFVRDLEEFPIPEIEVAIQIYRRDPKSKFFPTPGALRAIILDGRKERADLEKLGPALRNFDSRPIMWWAIPKTLWRDHWLEDDIPAEHVEAYRKRQAMQKQRAA